jgi:hypothetical protein
MVYSRELWLIGKPLLTERESSLERGDDREDPDTCRELRYAAVVACTVCIRSDQR